MTIENELDAYIQRLPPQRALLRPPAQRRHRRHHDRHRRQPLPPRPAASPATSNATPRTLALTSLTTAPSTPPTTPASPSSLPPHPSSVLIAAGIADNTNPDPLAQRPRTAIPLPTPLNLNELSLPRIESANVGEDALRDHPEDERRARRRRRSRPSALRLRRRAGEDSRCILGSALSRAVSSPLPTSRLPAIQPASASDTAVAATGRTSTNGRAPVSGRISAPARAVRRPAQPPHVRRRVRDHPEHEHDADDRAAELERQPATRRELTRERTDPRRRTRPMPSPAPDTPTAQAADRRAPIRQAPRTTRSRSRTAIAQATRGTTCAASRAGQHQLRAPRVLLGRAAHRTTASRPTTAAKIASVPPTRQAL